LCGRAAVVSSVSGRRAPPLVRRQETLQLIEPVLDDVDLRGFRLTDGFDHQEMPAAERTLPSALLDYGEPARNDG
jgi:hypothetical protein